MVEDSLRGNIFTIDNKKKTKKIRFPCSISQPLCDLCTEKNPNKDDMNALEAEFTRTVREHRSTIYTVCYMFSNDQDEVADLFQEVLINLWKSFETFEGRSNVRSWIYRVSLNVCISIDRKKKRHKTVPLTMDINPYEETETNSNSRQMDMLRRRIAKLPEFDRAIILLWLENMSYEEIGLVCGITPKNVSVRLYRIKEQLKQMSND